LHPAGQALIAKLISIACQNDVQIIIETHSDHFLNGVRTSVKSDVIDSESVSIYFLTHDNESSKHVTDYEAIKIEPTGHIDHWPNGFFDEWDKSLNELINGN